MIYLIQNGHGQTKIGIAKSPVKRLKQLQTGSATDLKLIHTISTIDCKWTDKNIEAKLHYMLKLNRKRGEWFELGDECIQWLSSIHHADQLYR